MKFEVFWIEISRAYHKKKNSVRGSNLKGSIGTLIFHNFETAFKSVLHDYA